MKIDQSFAEVVLRHLKQLDGMDEESQGNTQDMLYEFLDDDGVARVNIISDLLLGLSSWFEELSSKLPCEHSIWEESWQFFDVIIDQLGQVLTTDAPREIFQPLFTFLQEIWEERPEVDDIESQFILTNLIVKVYYIVEENFKDLKEELSALVPENILEMMENIRENYGAGTAKLDKAQEKQKQQAVWDQRMEKVVSANNRLLEEKAMLAREKLRQEEESIRQGNAAKISEGERTALTAAVNFTKDSKKSVYMRYKEVRERLKRVQPDVEDREGVVKDLEDRKKMPPPKRLRPSSPAPSPSLP